MNPLMSRMMARHAPPMNAQIMEGLAVSALKHLEAYLDSQIRSVCVGLPENVRYIGYERCTPQQEYDEATMPRGNRRTYNLARSYLHLNKYFFGFTDASGREHVVTKYIYLPFCTDAGILELSGSKYHIIPVLSDKVFTPGRDSIFVRLTQDRNNMMRVYHIVVINGQKQAKYVVWATIHRKVEDTQSGKSTKAKTTLVHYLFGKYGFTETFRRYAGVVPIVGTDETITSHLYPTADWYICESTRNAPETCLQKAAYTGTRIRLAVRKDQWNESMESLITGFFYVVDHFPDRFEADISYLDDVSLWMILLGHILFSFDQGENMLYNEIKDHYSTIDPYLDTAVKVKLSEKGIFLDNYYDLLHYIQVNFRRMICQNETDGLCVYGKNLEILQHLLYEILYFVARAKFDLNKQLSRIANKRDFTLADLEKGLRQIKPGKIYKLSRTILIQPMNSSSDHKYPKITSVVAQHENYNGGAARKKTRVVASQRHWIDPSMVFFGSLLNLPKHTPTPVARINPWVSIDEATGTVIPNPKFVDLIERNKPKFKL